jgi:L-fuconolactonase
MIIDAHQHFWDPARGDYGWLKPDMPIHRTYGPGDLGPLLRAAGVDGTILVQAAPTAAETDYMLDIARRTPWILGVVGWIDLEARDASAQIRLRAQNPLFLGVRPMLQDIAQPGWILRGDLDPAPEAIAAEDLVFEALVRASQIGVIDELAGRRPWLRIALDHGAKPELGNAHAMTAWRNDMVRLARLSNVTCKLSGLLTGLPTGVAIEHAQQAASILFDLFGPERLIWGSDWPVLTLASDYQDWFTLAYDVIAKRHAGAMGAVMGSNAMRIYRPKLQSSAIYEVPPINSAGSPSNPSAAIFLPSPR